MSFSSVQIKKIVKKKAWKLASEKNCMFSWIFVGKTKLFAPFRSCFEFEFSYFAHFFGSRLFFLNLRLQGTPFGLGYDNEFAFFFCFQVPIILNVCFRFASLIFFLFFSLCVFQDLCSFLFFLAFVGRFSGSKVYKVGQTKSLHGESQVRLLLEPLSPQELSSSLLRRQRLVLFFRFPLSFFPCFSLFENHRIRKKKLISSLEAEFYFLKIRFNFGRNKKMEQDWKKKEIWQIVQLIKLIFRYYSIF